VPMLRRPRSAASSQWNGYCANMNGTNNAFNGGSQVSRLGDGTTEFTIHLHYKHVSVSGANCIISNATLGGLIISIYTSYNSLRLAATVDGQGETWTGVSNTSNISNDTCYHIVALVTLADGATTTQLYLNGVKQTGSFSSPGAVEYRASGVGIGRDERDDNGNISPFEFTAMKIAQIAFWEGTLSAAQIKALYFNGKPRSPLNVERGGAQRYSGGTKPHLYTYVPITENDKSTNYPSTSTFHLADYALENSSGAPSTWTRGDNGTEGFAFYGINYCDIDNNYMGE